MRTLAVIIFFVGLACFSTRDTAMLGLPVTALGMWLYGRAARRALGDEHGFIVAVLAVGALGAAAVAVEAVIQRL